MLVGGGPPAIDGVDIGDDEQRIGVQVEGEEGAGVVLVYDGLDIGDDEERMGLRVEGEEGAGVVLVYDGLDSDELAPRRDRNVGVHDGDAAATRARDDRVVLEQPLDRLDAEDSSRRG